MNTPEASLILFGCLEHYRSQTYARVSTCVDEHRIQILPEVPRPSGKRYNVTVTFSWHDKPRSDVRVTASVGMWFPLTQSLVIARGDPVVGE